MDDPADGVVTWHAHGAGSLPRMARIVWIASYPKSGNTWVRFLVAHLLYKDVTSSADVQRFVPDIHRSISAGHLLGERLTFVKTHWKYHDRLPLREDTRGVIYIVRHPLDIIASNWNYFVLRRESQFFALSESEVSRMKDDYIDQFISTGGAREWIRLGMGTLPENVVTWLDEGVPFPRLVLRYEDLHRDAGECLVRLCKFIGARKTDDQIAAAVRRSAFEVLREMEAQEVAQRQPGIFLAENREPAHTRGVRFMAKGQVSRYREVLSERQIGEANERFARLIARFGYDAPAQAALTTRA